MVTYKHEVFSSKNNSFVIEQVDAKMVYDWVKNGELSHEDFSQYIDDVRSNSRDGGYESGWTDGYESGIEGR